MSSTVHQRKSGSSQTSRGQASKKTISNSNKTNFPITDRKKLSLALSQLKESALTSGLTPERFQICAERASKQMKLHPPSSQSSRCVYLIIILKVIWLLFLLLLAVALLSVAVKPVVFYMHKMLHTHMYTITRPVRLLLVSLLPHFQTLGFDFLHQDCLLENPLLSPEDRCPCTHVKYPTVFSLNSTHTRLSHEVLQLPLSEVVVIEGGISIPSNLSIEHLLTSDPRTGATPLVCTELTVDGQDGIQFYRDLFNKKKMNKMLKNKEPWTFSWEECPDPRNRLTLRSSFPPPTGYLPSDLNTSSNALFTITTQWAPSSYYSEVLSEARLILTTVVFGEVRLMLEPVMDSKCMDVCTGFKGHPVLKQGDSVIFDQQFWSYQATTWSKLALTYSVALT